MPMKRAVLAIALAALSLVACRDDHTVATDAADPSQWSAVDALGRTIDPDDYPAPRDDRQVGIFYFLWLGCHGYDTPANGNDVAMPTDADTLSPFDNSLLTKHNPDYPAFGPPAAMHHWGEPHFGYYLSNDEWVMRRHAQLLGDAVVDVIFFHVTNGYTYLPIVERLCAVYEDIRSKGGRTPQVAFILNSNPAATLAAIYDGFYKPRRHPELWYERDGKPLILVPEDAATDEHRDFFTIRRAWFASHPAAEGEWFGDGRDRWTWGDYYPQQAGWHDSPDKPEQISILPATHPHTLHGRSHDGVRQPDAADCDSGRGIYFARQIDRALEVDPQFVFITGWNEWTAQRQVFPAGTEIANSYRRPEGTTFFVDQFTEEFSRDIEPMRGGFGDNYYYQMADFIRRYKGATPVPVRSRRHTMRIDGRFGDRRGAEAVYDDYEGDTSPRDARGWGRIGRYANDSGRNDIVRTWVCSDKENIYFSVRCARPITAPDEEWMMLFVSTRGDGPRWEGFDYAVNRSIGKLERSAGGWRWAAAAEIEYAVDGCDMELALPLKALGIDDPDNFTVDFKWIDNACAEGDITECMDRGDAAPDARYKYRYRFKR